MTIEETPKCSKKHAETSYRSFGDKAPMVKVVLERTGFLGSNWENMR
jgi:hypothetical protein